MPSSRPLSVLVVHDELPTYDRQSGSLRLFRYVEVMVQEGHHVTFLARAGIGQERYAEELRALGVEVHPVDTRLLREEGFGVAGLGVDLRLLLRRSRFDVAYLNFYGTAERYLPPIRAHSPATRIVIDTHDVHYLRERRGAELAGDAAALAAAEETRRREAAIYSQADVLAAVSEDDAQALRELAPEVPVEIVSNVHVEAPPGPAFAERRGLVFVANFDHKPNVDAILDFHATSWPLIAAEVPDAHLMIVGYAPPPEVKALHGERITVTGQVPEVAPYLDGARISIAPLRYGAGVKGKVGEALMHGLPVVTTPIGAEGMGLNDGEHVLIAEPGEELARAVVRLYGDEALWERLSAAGRAHTQRRYGVAAAVDSLRRTFGRAVPQVFLARLQDWTGDAVGRLIGGYLASFQEGDPVSLVIPVTPDDPEPDAACQMLVDAIAATGTDPGHGPDIAVVPCAERPVLPFAAVEVDAAAPRWAVPGAAGDAGERPRASIIIPAYGKRELTEKCLTSLELSLGDRLGGEIELVLVDNSSLDSTLELFSQWSDRARVVALPANRNFAGGINAGAAVATGRVLVVVSTDMELGRGAVDALLEEAEKPGVGLVGARMRYPDGRLQHGGIGWRRVSYGILPFHLFHYEPAELPYARTTLELSAVTGGCIAIPADLFELVGGFDEGYVNGWEDADLCLKVRSAGAAVRYRGDTDIVHHEGATSGASYHGNGNAERFIGRWGRMLTDDAPLLARALGAGISPIIDLPVPADDPAGAPVRVVGPVSGIGPRAAEARGLARALAARGIDIAARTPAPTWIGPAIDEPRWRELAAVHARPAAPEAEVVSFGEEAEGPSPDVLRLGRVVERPSPEVLAWAACPAVAEGLIDAGWDASAVEVVAPFGIESHPGRGGEGVLVVLPVHDPALTAAVLAGLRGVEGVPVRVLPTVWTPDLAAAVKAALPDAQLLHPTTDERAVAALAAASDFVVALDPADEFDRTTLTAAAAGAAVAVRPGGPAEWVLGELAHAIAPADLAALGELAGRTDRSEAARKARIDAVMRVCGAVAATAAR